MNPELSQFIHSLVQIVFVVLAITTLGRVNVWLDKQEELYRHQKGLFKASASKSEDN